MAKSKQSTTTEITPFVPAILNELNFKEIKARHLLDHSNTQRVAKGESYFHHMENGFNYTYLGFHDDKRICLIDPRSRALLSLTEKQLMKNFKFSGPATKHKK